MSELLSNQLYFFLVYCLSGVLIGIFFDIFRILRKSFKTADIITYFEDILFWILTGIFLTHVIFKFNNGEIRNYIFIGIGLGILLYLLVFSKIFIKINVIIINFIKQLIKKIYLILLYPILKTIKKIFVFFYHIAGICNKKVQKFTNIIIFYIKKCKTTNKIQKKTK